MRHQAFTILLLGSLVGSIVGAKNEKLTCAEIFCGVGRECVDTLGEPFCDCVEKCKDKKSSVCGSDGVSYDSECELYRAACVNNQQIEIVSNMTCEEESDAVADILNEMNEKKEMPTPLVCLEQDRDRIRMALIDWLIKEEEGMKIEGISYKGLLKNYFDLLDTNKDMGIDTMEFMKLLEKNETVTDVLSTDQHANPILRGLCIDSLIQVTDINSDYKLTFAEFHKCLDPDFKPPKTRCELEGIRFKDGQVVAVNCNTCKCACGNWVCTSLECDEKEKGKEKTTQVEV